MPTTRVTPEQAKHCPRCNQMGETVNTYVTPHPTTGRPTKVHVIQCRNLSCNWYQTNWVVQEDEDGKVPVRDSGHEPKTFPKLKRSLTQSEAMAAIEVLTREVPSDEIR